MARAVIGIGSNLAHPRRQVAHALRAIARLPRTHLIKASGNYVGAPIGCADQQPDYVNAVAIINTSLPPRALLLRLLSIERARHRRRHAGDSPNAARTLDLDLLLYGARRISTRALSVPHPRMHERAFVLRPLVDIAPTDRIAGRGLARRLLRHIRGQRIARTRRHALP